MNRHAKAPSSATATREGSRLGAALRGAFATRDAFGRGDGSGAPKARLLLGALATALVLALPAAASAEPPTLTIDPVAGAETTKAPVSGEIDAHGLSTEWLFETSTNGTDWLPHYEVYGFASGSSLEPIAGTLEGLTAGQAYEVRIAATPYEGDNAFQTEHSSAVSFTTDPAPVAPVLDLPAPTASYTTAGPLQGTVDPEGGNEEASGAVIPIHWVIETSETGDPGTWTEVSSGDISDPAASESNPISVPEAPAEATGLQPNTTYHYRLRATYAGQEVTTPDDTFTTEPVAKPTPEDLQVTGVTGTSAHFSAKVKTNAPAGPLDPATEAAYQANWNFSPGGSSGSTAATVAEETVTGEATGLTPNENYVATFTVSNAGGSEELSVPFTTAAIKPTITRAILLKPTRTSIQLNAGVDPHNAPLTDCRFQYGATAVTEHEAPCEGGASAKITGLTPGTEYSFRLLATNAAGTTEGDVRTFTSLAEPSAEPCPNQIFRDAQRVDALPECRAFEMVSPLAKGGGDIVGDGGTNVASTDGDAVSFSTRTPFGDTIGSGVAGQTQYVARRGAGGWSSHSITPQPRADTYQTYFGATRYQAFSEDLSRAVLFGRDFPAASGDLPDRNSLYVEDTASRALRPVTMSQNGLPSPLPDPLFEMSQEYDWGISSDARHVAFVSRVPYLPAVKQAQELSQQSSGAPNVYQWDDGVLSLAGVLPDGTIPSTGSDVPTVPGSPFTRPHYREAMSSDGSRLLFVSPPTGTTRQLYQRIDGQRTVWISQPEGADQSQPQKVLLLAAAPDGHNVFFSTTSALVDEDTDGVADLYRYTDSVDPATEPNLTMITRDGFQGRVIGVGDDGQRVYYQTTNDEIVVWDHGVSQAITSLVPIEALGQRSLSAGSWGPGLGRVTPDGRYLAFATDFSYGLDPNGLVGPTGDITNYRMEMYLYDLATDTLSCVSCPPGAPVVPEDTATDEGIVSPSATTGVITYTMPGIRPRFLSDSGRVFFTSPEALVPRDTNGVRDAYQYDPATGLSLLSTGKGSEPATFTEAGPGGDDVFLVTRQRLVASDTDDLVDLYDVRVRGGFAEAPPPPPARPCDGELCQGVAAAAPASPASSSAGAGRGNLRQKRCGPGRHRVRRHGRSRCVEKPSKHKGHKTGRTR